MTPDHLAQRRQFVSRAHVSAAAAIRCLPWSAAASRAASLIAAIRLDGLALPLPADSMFHERARASYDVALCMYHDQALIPIKTLAFDHAVNVTLGLPFVRTSPDHGTAFDIAGTGKADPSSLIAALTLAARLVATQPALVPAK